MTRYIAYLGPINLRLHKFYRGDDDRASHTHPWWFITLPFTSYVESVFNKGSYVTTRLVKAWRFHWRPAGFEHIVLGATKKTFWTLVIAGYRDNEWGFYPEPGVFIHWRNYEPS